MNKIKNLGCAMIIAMISLNVNAQITSSTGGAAALGANVPTSNTNLGVGINNPSQKLHVNGSGMFSNLVAPVSAALIRGNNTFSTATTPDYTWFGNHQTGIFHPAVTGSIRDAIGLSVRGMEAVRYHQFADAALPPNLYTETLFNGAVIINGKNRYGGPMLIIGGNATTSPNGEWGIESVEGQPNNGLNFWKPWPNSNGLGGQNSILFLANGTGNVGINTNNPTAKLTVNGNVLIGNATTLMPVGYKLYVDSGILADAVKVAVVNSTDWSDYVFNDTYKLRSLNEVEAFIKANKHLPNVPSADQIVKDGGIEMKAMFATQMEKIEELTLYIIEQNKKLEAQNNRILQLEKANNKQ